MHVWRNNVGVDLERGIRYGLGNGSPDLVGFLLDGTARMVAFEVKTPTGRESKDQKCWHEWFRARGGFVATVRSTDDAMLALTRAENGNLQ